MPTPRQAGLGPRTGALPAPLSRDTQRVTLSLTPPRPCPAPPDFKGTALPSASLPLRPALCGKLCFLLPSATSAGAALKLCHVEIAQRSPGPRSPPRPRWASDGGGGEGCECCSAPRPSGHRVQLRPGERVEPRKAAGKGRGLIQSAKDLRAARLCASVCVRGEAGASKPGLPSAP